MKEKTEKEIELLKKVGLVLNGYSKAFRKLFYDKNQDERIEFMKSILEEAKEESEARMYHELNSEMTPEDEVLDDLDTRKIEPLTPAVKR